MPPDVLLSHDGLSFLRGIIAGTFPAPPITETLGFALIAVEEGSATFAGTPTMRHYNPIGTVHGGYAATLLDSALGCAVHSTLARGEAYTTLEFSIKLVRAITGDSGQVTARGRIVHRGRSIATADAELRDAKGKLCAHASTICMIFPAKNLP